MKDRRDNIWSQFFAMKYGIFWGTLNGNIISWNIYINLYSYLCITTFPRHLVVFFKIYNCFLANYIRWQDIDNIYDCFLTLDKHKHLATFTRSPLLYRYEILFIVLRKRVLLPVLCVPFDKLEYSIVRPYNCFTE